jgi:hypothetical protein
MVDVQSEEVAIIIIVAEDGRMIDATIPDVVNGVEVELRRSGHNLLSDS